MRLVTALSIPTSLKFECYRCVIGLLWSRDLKTDLWLVETYWSGLSYLSVSGSWQRSGQSPIFSTFTFLQDWGNSNQSLFQSQILVTIFRNFVLNNYWFLDSLTPSCVAILDESPPREPNLRRTKRNPNWKEEQRSRGARGTKIKRNYTEEVTHFCQFRSTCV